MPKTELEYNPYLNETIVRFNGKEPKINSLVEKYDKEIFQKWIQFIPDIFHDEMNGYDFDLEFTGTELDFNELKQAFKKSKVTEEMVRLIHMKPLENRYQKLERISQLL
ncbi:MAG: hypothetical protein HUJ53_03170, partial [Holdemanella sp.]|nr:hypothetical protein [Holdemanella sp.]